MTAQQKRFIGNLHANGERWEIRQFVFFSRISQRRKCSLQKVLYGADSIPPRNSDRSANTRLRSAVGGGVDQRCDHAAILNLVIVLPNQGFFGADIGPGENRRQRHSQIDGFSSLTALKKKGGKTCVNPPFSKF